MRWVNADGTVQGKIGEGEDQIVAYILKDRHLFGIEVVGLAGENFEATGEGIGHAQRQRDT